MRLRVGCSGWSYPEWVGPFYPRGTQSGDFLKHYARVFDVVEVDSTFYAVPDPSRVERWRKETPEGFVFCAKLPQEVTGGRRTPPASGKAPAEPPAAEVLGEFLHAIDRLGDKRGPLVAQFPPSYGKKGHAEEFRGLLDGLGGRRCAFEFRHESWFEPATYRALTEANAALVWSEVAGMEVPPQVTADFALVRFIGDRSFEPAGGTVERKGPAMARWASRLEEREEGLKDGFVFFNNHFEGFGPESVNRFLSKVGRSPVDWRSLLEGGGPAQRRLGEF